MKRIVQKILRFNYEVSWLDFTDEQLSMVLSHIAGGGSFCAAPECLPAGKEAVETITDDKNLREFLLGYGYESLGCVNDIASSSRAHYLAMTELRIARGDVRRWVRERPPS
jgi:hypothetical protein